MGTWNQNRTSGAAHSLKLALSGRQDHYNLRHFVSRNDRVVDRRCCVDSREMISSTGRLYLKFSLSESASCHRSGGNADNSALVHAASSTVIAVQISQIGRRSTVPKTDPNSRWSTRRALGNYFIRQLFCSVSDFSQRPLVDVHAIELKADVPSIWESMPSSVGVQ